MNKTTSLFVTSLKSRPLADYSLSELQVGLTKTYHYYNRFKGKEERASLNQVWIKLSEEYNRKLAVVYPEARKIFSSDYLKQF